LRQDLLRQALPWLVLLVGGGLVLAAAPRPTTQARGAVTVVYVGAEDCGPCRAWRRDRRAAFLDSGEFARLRYREIIAPRLRDLLTQADWPADLADLREQVRALAGAPQWFVLRDGKTLASGAGLSAWQHRIWPAIRVQVRHDPPRGGAAVSALFALPQACRGGSVRECVRDTTKEPDDPS
jgi:hypothetical protein